MAKSTAHGSVTNLAALREQSMRTGRTVEELQAEQAAIPEQQDGTTAPEPDQEPKDKPSTPSRPAQGDPKAAWVDYAVSQGAAREDAEKETKGDLIKAYGD